MLPLVQEWISRTAKWSNDNTGVVSVCIFLTTLLFGWSSGIFQALRRKPKFKLRIIPGPTFSCTFPTGKTHETYTVHRTAIALYIAVTNIGSSSSSICGVSVGYHWNLQPFSVQWLKYGVGWFWLHDQAIALEDFQCKIGESTKFFPFLIQASSVSLNAGETFLEVGRSTNGVVYFEQADSWGGCLPKPEDDTIKITVSIRDSFDRLHKRKFRIPCVSLDHARKFNPSFGKTRAELHKEPLPFDSERGGK